MGFIDVVRETIKDLQVSEAIRERLFLALDRLKDAESKVNELQKANGALETQLDRERRDHNQTRQELRRIEAEHAEEVRIYESVEFRRGKRTGGGGGRRSVLIAICRPLSIRPSMRRRVPVMWGSLHRSLSAVLRLAVAGASVPRRHCSK